MDKKDAHPSAMVMELGKFGDQKGNIRHLLRAEQQFFLSVAVSLQLIQFKYLNFN